MDAYVTCSTMGGIGQLLFQLAHCLSYAKCNELTPCAPLDKIDPAVVARLNLRDYFTPEVEVEASLREVFFPCLYDGEKRQGEKNVRLVGLVQGEEWITFPTLVRNWLAPLKAPLIPHSVGLHIRGGESRAMGGESLTPKQIEATLKRDYTKGDVLYIFTDDKVYADELLLPIRERLEEMFPDTRWYVSDGQVEGDLNHLRRMTSMQVLICSASAFSWWGAWLGSAKKVYWPATYDSGGWNQYMSALRSKGWEWVVGKWEIIPEKEGGKKVKCNLLIVIQSCRKYKCRRETCRESWLKHLPFGVEYFFAVGGDTSDDLGEGDVVSLRCSDNYFNLHLKTREMFRYALEHYDFNYLLKCDDDTYVVVDRAERLVEGHEFLSDRYVTATGGGGYFLSQGSTELLVQELGVKDIPYTPEDVLVTKTLKNLRVRKDGTSFILRHFLNGFPTHENSLVTTHYVYEKEAEIIENVLYSPHLHAFLWRREIETDEDQFPILYLYGVEGELRFAMSRPSKWHGKGRVEPSGNLRLISDGDERDLLLRHIGDGYWEEERVGSLAIVSPLFPSAIDDLLLQSEGNGVE